jgi:hypothetical protein
MAKHESLNDIMSTVFARGGQPPTTAVMNGGVLNRLLGTDEYDPARAYTVSQSGIEEFRDGCSDGS